MSETSLCALCGHAAHNSDPCEVLMMWDRPGGIPGNGTCRCGHPVIAQTVTTWPATSDQVISDLRSQLAAAQKKAEESEQAKLLSLFDRYGVECSNCGSQIISRGGSIKEQEDRRCLSSTDEGDLALCGYCMGLEFADLDKKFGEKCERITDLESQLAARDRTLGDVRREVEREGHAHLCPSTIAKLKTPPWHEFKGAVCRSITGCGHCEKCVWYESNPERKVGECNCFRSRLLALLPGAVETRIETN